MDSEEFCKVDCTQVKRKKETGGEGEISSIKWRSDNNSNLIILMLFL